MRRESRRLVAAYRRPRIRTRAERSGPVALSIDGYDTVVRAAVLVVDAPPVGQIIEEAGGGGCAPNDAPIFHGQICRAASAGVLVDPARPASRGHHAVTGPDPDRHIVHVKGARLVEAGAANGRLPWEQFGVC